jgi:phosphoglycerate dehydrogenase-like enzyme
MPSRYFRAAFAALNGHAVAYADVDSAPPPAAPTPSQARLREYHGSPAELIARMAGVDVLVVHGAPVTDAVLDASGALKLVCCARGGPVNVVNTARESLVDEAALDVVRTGSEPGRHPLLRRDNVVITPHLGGATRETLAQGAEMLAAEIARFAAGEPLVNVVGTAR